ncbi:MAG: holo-ACP synthase [Propionivibrio sp.]|jgi:holo-[acyl-carrier protein] synthase
MIHGVGTDIAAVARLAALYEKHGERALEKLLAPAEREGFERAADKGRFLAKRFAAKEAFGKALGIGVAAPATLPNVAIDHDTLGKPVFAYAPELDAWLRERGLIAHLSISDEKDYATAFVVVERLSGQAQASS